MPYPGIDGFLGTRASIMLDIVFLAMFAIVPLLGWSIWLVKYRHNYALHKRMQLALALVLLGAVGLFEIDMRFISGWQPRAEASPYYAPPTEPSGLATTVFQKAMGFERVPGTVFTALGIHLIFAITTAVLWVGVTIAAVMRFDNPPRPGSHSATHLFWAKLAAVDMLMTSVTGWIFYWLAFVA